MHSTNRDASAPQIVVTITASTTPADLLRTLESRSPEFARRSARTKARIVAHVLREADTRGRRRVVITPAGLIAA